MSAATTSFVSTISHLREVTQSINNSKTQDLVTTRSLYVALSKVLESAKYAPQTELVASANLSVLEDIFSGKYIVLSKGMQTLLISIYGLILATTPGYSVRNVVNSLMTTCGNKAALSGSRECASTVIGDVMLKRPMDCGSMVNDIIACMVKLVKGSEHGLRISSLNCLVSITVGSGNRIGDCHAELAKLAMKLVSDKAADIRYGACRLTHEISRNSAGCSTVPIDVLLPPVIKGLEDDVAVVQEVSALAVAVTFNEQIDSYLEEQELAKIGQARGGSSEADADTSRSSRFGLSRGSGSLAKLKDMTSGGRKNLIDEYDFKSVIRHLIKQVLKSSGTLRAGYIIALMNLIRIRVLSLETADFDWLVDHIIGILHDPSVASLSYEDTVYFRSRIAYLLRNSVTCNLSESAQIAFASRLTQFVSTNESHSEHELQLALGELAHVITALGEAAIALLEDVRKAASLQLRNSSFGVRAAAAFVLAAIAAVIPAIAAAHLRDALTNSMTQVKLLTTYDPNDVSIPEDVLDATGTSAKKKGPKELERLQRMYCFHGHTLVISIFLKNERWLPAGLPKELILEVFDFGLELLKQDVMAAPQNVRHVICSVIRAGSLIVSSCLNMGYKIARTKISRLMSHCNVLLSVTSTPLPTSESTNELLYELMSVEAALVCISTLLWFCPEALVYADHCLVSIVEGLESAFRAVKAKYQPKFRNHFRFRALHAILLECFAWLPPGSFPNSCQQLFVEALRVFRDSITAGHECTCLYEFIRPEFNILNVSGIQKPPFLPGGEVPLNECAMMLKLESNAIALQKKESEAFLAAFTKDVRWSDFHQTHLQTSVWTEPCPPCAHLDSRTVDASIALLAASFGHQTNEYQEKAMQLCSQAVSQFLKANNSLGLFSSEEEKRRKEKKGFIIVKNVISALSAIVRSFPFHSGMSLDLDLIWVQSVADRMFEMLSYQNVDIRAAAANALSIFCAKIHGSSLMENMCSKIGSTLRAALEKKSESMNEFLGHILALACLWEHSKEMPDIQSSISSVILDCLKKVDCSLSFRAFSIFAMSIMVKNRAVGASMQDVNETLKMVTRVCQVAETHLVCVSGGDTTSSYEFDLLLVCLQRLINNTVPVILDVDPTSSLIVRFVQLWDMIRSCSTHALLEKEAMDFVVAVCLFPPGVTTIDRLSVAKGLYQTLEKRAELSFVSLQGTVEAVRALMLQDAECAFQAGLDIELFKLLDWCIASSTVTCSSSYWGLELRPGVEAALGSARELQQCVELVLDSLVSIGVKQSPDTRAVHWALLCRAVALGLRVGATGEDDATGKDAGAGEGESSLEVFERDSKKVVKEAPSVMTYQLFCTWARDRAVDKAQGISAARVRLKCVAIRCATTALYGVVSEPAHTDVALARRLSQQHLEQLGQSPESSKLETIACYIPLFLHDFVNFACACATYSIEDNRLLSLLAASAEFLECLLTMFWTCPDPDAINPDENVLETQNKNRILQQFISQIVSALRTCLSAEWHPSLLFTTGGLAVDLMRGGFLSDRVMIRRVAKLLLPQILPVPQTEGEGATASAAISLRAVPSQLVADELFTIAHIVTYTNTARLLLLTLTVEPCRDVYADIKITLASILQESLQSYTDIWFALCLDASRLLQGVRNWPKLSESQATVRGGVCFSAEVDASLLVPHLELSLPFLIAATAHSTILKSGQSSVVFAIALTLLEDLKSSTFKSSRGAGVSESNRIVFDIVPQRVHGGKRTFVEDLVLSAVASIARNHNKQFETIPIVHWNRLLTFLIARLIPSRLYDMAEDKHTDDAVLSLCSTYIDVFDPLIGQLVTLSCGEELITPSVGEMTALLRLGTLSVTIPVFDMLFTAEVSHQSLVAGSLPTVQRYVATVLKASSITRLQALASSGLLSRVLAALCTVARSSLVMTTFCAKLVSALVPLLAITLPAGNLKSDTLTSVYQQLSFLCGIHTDGNKSPAQFSFSVPVDEVMSLVLSDLSLWQKCLAPGSEVVSKKGLSSSSIAVPASTPAELSVLVVEALLGLWRHLASLREGSIPIPTQISVLLLQRDINLDFIRAILGVLLRGIQGDASKMGPLLANMAVPAILVRLSEPTGATDDLTELIMIQIVFLLFSITPEARREALLAMILQPLCAYISARPLEATNTQMCGKGITHLARTCPELFRMQVAVLSEQHRTTLQSIMRAVMEQQSVNSTASSVNSSDAVSNVKKIDISRYRKS